MVDYPTGVTHGAWGAVRDVPIGFTPVVHRATGAVPDRLQLLYLGNGRSSPTKRDLEDLERFRTETGGPRKAIKRAAETQDLASMGVQRSAGWCSHQALSRIRGTLPAPRPASVANVTTVEG